jgi:hypothetical protein
MLDLGRYLLGVTELGLLVGFAWLGAAAVRRRLVPALVGAPAHLATGVLALALLLWTAEILGSVGLLEALPYMLAVVTIGFGTWAVDRGSCRRGGVPSLRYALLRAEGRSGMRDEALPSAASARRRSPHPDATRGRGVGVATLIALAIAAAAVIHFALEVKPKLSTGMTGFDSTWYHGPFAAAFFQGGDTWGLHFIAPQFLAWFYPANSEVFHGIGMLAFSRDLMSPLLNFGWLVGCLFAGWCIGRPYKVAPISLALTAMALSVPALSDQAGEARNDIVGIFFLLAAVAVAVNAWATRSDVADAQAAEAGGEDAEAGSGLSSGALVVAGLAAGLAAGTKLNFLLPDVVLVAGFAVIAPQGGRWRALAAAGLAALAGGGYWYLRNLAHTGNPLPWFDHVGPISLPAPDQALGGREAHSALGYLTDGSIWSDWFLPGLHDGLTLLWPLLVLAAIAGLFLCLGRRSDPVLRVAALAGLAAGFAWLIAPTSASGPEGMPRGFESGLRYLAPALVLGLALLPTAPLTHFATKPRFYVSRACKCSFVVGPGRPVGLLAIAGLGLLAMAIGYPVQRHYLENRYANPTFTTPGLNATFKWAQDIDDARIATTSTRQYPLFGRDLSNHVDYIGEAHPHGGFTAPSTCRTWRNLLNAGNYDYVVASRDRIEPHKPPYPPSAAWTEGPGATVILRTPPTVVYKLKNNRLSPSACR